MKVTMLMYKFDFDSISSKFSIINEFEGPQFSKWDLSMISSLDVKRIEKAWKNW